MSWFFSLSARPQDVHKYANEILLGWDGWGEGCLAPSARCVHLTCLSAWLDLGYLPTNVCLTINQLFQQLGIHLMIVPCLSYLSYCIYLCYPIYLFPWPVPWPSWLHWPCICTGSPGIFSILIKQSMSLTRPLSLSLSNGLSVLAACMYTRDNYRIYTCSRYSVWWEFTSTEHACADRIWCGHRVWQVEWRSDGVSNFEILNIEVTVDFRRLMRSDAAHVRHLTYCLADYPRWTWESPLRIN